MKTTLSVSLLLAAVLMTFDTPTVRAETRRKADRIAMFQAGRQPWHGEYYNTSRGYPQGLVVPPTANASTEWGWGVTATEVRPIHHQYLLPHQGGMEGGEGTQSLPTPPWPSHTRQFGTYYIRGPW